MTRVLVVRPSSLGDVVHALPIAADIASALPLSSIDWIAEEPFAPIVALNRHVHRIVPVALRRWRHHPASGSTWREMTRFRREIREVRYDVVLDLQEQMKGALMSRLAHGAVHGFDRDSIRERASTWLHDRHHAVSRDLHFNERCRALAGQALGYVPHGPPLYGLEVPVPAQCLTFELPYAVCVHVTSRDDKRWPEAHWHAVIDALDRAGITSLLPWGNDAERARSAALARGHSRAVVPEHTPLADLAAVMARAKAVIGVDTGLVHLAAALHVPTVAIFTSTDARLAGVAVTGAHAIDLGGNADIPSAQAVMQALAKVSDAKAPC
ncbi:MAG: lipopolysaccharide heptosyltransferase I [Pseudomonadota bacterium]|nr:lipopolysaccharide heptosyltransferase I [Pseudomonadota bacterium]